MPLRKLWPFRNKKKKPVGTAGEYSVPERVYTPVGLLEIGMYVIELDRPWLDSPFLFQGFEKEFDLPSISVYSRNRRSGQFHVVGDKGKSLFRFRVLNDNHP